MTAINQDFHLLEITPNKYIFQCYKVHNLPPIMESFFLADLQPAFTITPDEVQDVGVPLHYPTNINNRHLNLPRRSPFIYEIPNGSVLGHSNIVINKHNQFSVEGLIFNAARDNKWRGDEPTQNFVINPDKPDSSTINFKFNQSRVHGEAIHIGCHYNFGHWLFNHLGRLAFIQQSEYLRQLPLVLPNTATGKHLECLKYFGYNTDRIILTENSTLHRFEKLWAPTFPWYIASDNIKWLSSGVIDFLRRGFRTDKTETTHERKRILISRQNAKWRRPINESDLLQALEPFNFELLKLENNSIASQIEIASQAEIIISPVGAGSNLCIFAPVNTILVEVEPSTNNTSLFHLGRECCQRIGQPFYKVTGLANPVENQQPCDADYEIDIAKMIEFLTHLNLST